MTVAMIVVVLGTYLVLERTASRDIQQVLDDRSRAVLAVLEQSADPVVASEDTLQPGMVVYDASGRRVMGSVATPLRSSADDLAPGPGGAFGPRRRGRGPAPRHTVHHASR